VTLRPISQVIRPVGRRSGLRTDPPTHCYVGTKPNTSLRKGEIVTTLKESAKKMWRATRKHLPPRVAEAIRVPTKRVLRKLGLIAPPKSRPRSTVVKAARSTY
jgi:hypothetical protein